MSARETLRPGYKETDVGVIPEDWEVRPFLKVLRIANGQVDPRDEPYKEMILVAPDHIGEGTGCLNTRQTASDQGAISGKYRFYEGDIVYSKIRPYLRKLILADFYGLCSADMYPLSPIDGATSDYCFYALLEDRFSNFASSVSARSGIPKINRNEIAQFQFLVPPPNEQRAIAEALSDVDALIAALDVLIAKKRGITQAAMQQLLTGKTRLPGFTGEWHNNTLQEVILCLDNLRIPLNESQRLTMQGDYPYCGANGILDYVNSYVIDDDFILIAEDGGYFDEFATCPIAYRMSGKCWVNNHAHILKAVPGVNQDFIFYALVHKNIMPFLASGTRAKLNKSEMYKIEISISDDIAEQTAIAEILSDMDAELSALESKRDKTRALKSGMMQELLTGRIRLL